MNLKTSCRLFITNKTGFDIYGNVQFGHDNLDTPYPAVGNLGNDQIYELLLAGDQTIGSICAFVCSGREPIQAVPVTPTTSMGTLYAEVVPVKGGTFKINLVDGDVAETANPID